MRVLVSGGAGFIGSHIVEALLGAGHQVLVLDDLSTGKRENVSSGAELAVIDLRDRDGVAKAVGSFRPDAISHQAAQASVVVSMRDPALDVQVNVLGSLHLLEAAVESGVKRFVFASTGGAIYGEVPEPDRADESRMPRPFSPYAISKLATEHLLGVYARERGLDVTVLRYANVYGPRQDPHGEAGVVAIFAASALQSKTLRVFGRHAGGDGGCVRDYVFVSDVVRANTAALEGRISPGVLNVGTGVGTTTQALAELVVAAAGGASPIESGPPRTGDVARSVLNVERYRELLGATTPLSAGLAQTVRWFRERAAAAAVRQQS
jgi:UDP-glucose 4-epimerase